MRKDSPASPGNLARWCPTTRAATAGLPAAFVIAAGDERARSPECWPGLNLLGFGLMGVRHKLRD